MAKSDFKVPLLLVLLSLVPVIGGLVRLNHLVSHVPVTVENARFVAAPIPAVIHIITATLYSLLGAFQFSQGFRLRRPSWHRSAGKILVVCGILVGLSGLWITLTYPIPVGLQGGLLYGVRLVVGTAMVTAILIGWKSILRRDIASHRAWMIRAYALGQGAGTQAVLMLPIVLVLGEFLGFKRDLVMSLAWVINLAIAEWVISPRKPKIQS